jgi:hypothetical protein
LSSAEGVTAFTVGEVDSSELPDALSNAKFDVVIDP